MPLSFSSAMMAIHFGALKPPTAKRPIHIAIGVQSNGLVQSAQHHAAINDDTWFA
jgi:hypothetical protein